MSCRERPAVHNDNSNLIILAMRNVIDFVTPTVAYCVHVCSLILVVLFWYNGPLEGSQ